jgi:hypothetical protein
VKDRQQEQRTIEEKMSLRFFDLLSAGCSSDLLHDVVNFGDASRVDGPALLLTGLSANVGSNIVQDSGEGDIDDIRLAEGGGNGELISSELVQGLGVEVADEELGAVIDILAVLLEENVVELISGPPATAVSGTSFTTASSESSSDTLTDNSSLDGSTDESLGDQDLGSDDDGSREDDLSLDVDDGHADDEGDHQENGLHFAVIGFLAFVLRKK